MAENIKLVNYKPEWNEYFKTEEKIIKTIIGNNCVATVHVGSTAIKGMKARNIVDIMVLVKDIFLVDECNEALEKQGYAFKESYGDSGRYVYIKEEGEPGYQLHFYEHEDYEDIQRMVAFRDYLEAHPDAAREYLKIKEQYTEECVEQSYSAAKGVYIKSIREKAIIWHEIQHKKNMAVTMGTCFGVLVAIVAGIASSSLLIGLGVGLVFGGCVGLAVGSSMKKKKQED